MYEQNVKIFKKTRNFMVQGEPRKPDIFKIKSTQFFFK